MKSKTEVFAPSASEISWSFESPEPVMRVGGGKYGHAEKVDPCPAYPHDIDLVRETLDRVANRFPISGDLSLYILPFESPSRTNGWTHGADYDHDGWDGNQYTNRRWTPTIVLSAKRIPPHPAMTRYLVAHEYGHAVAHELGVRAGYQLESAGIEIARIYAEFRGTEGIPFGQKYGPGTWHMAFSEVFANDFRILVCGVEPEYWPHPGIERPDSPALVNRLMTWWGEHDI